MASALSWLDASAEDQRRMREIVQLFNQTDSRDELGIGQIRDALSDSLFPGTSVLLTRARYLLFVPWCFQRAVSIGRPGGAVARERYERDLITALRDSNATQGLIGAQAGRAVKTLPSATYWNSLRRWDVLADHTFTWEDALSSPQVEPSDEADLAAPSWSAWSSTMPAAPSGFPQQVPGGFDLTRDEAEWLADRILTSCDGTLLAHLVEHRPQRDSRYAWTDPAALGRAPHAALETLEYARVFSLVVHGAALLYNLLLAEAYTGTGLNRLDDLTEEYRRRLAAWEAERDVAASAFDSWRFDEFRLFIGQRHATVSPRTWAFLRSWAKFAAPGTPSVADSTAARSFIADREREHKHGQARLRNKGLLATWSGAAGSSALNFRWPTVRGLLNDLHDGLERDRA